MAEWLGGTFQGYQMYSHDLEDIGSNPGRSKVGSVVGPHF